LQKTISFAPRPLDPVITSSEFRITTPANSPFGARFKAKMLVKAHPEVRLSLWDSLNARVCPRFAV
jgi:hypothetical protein